ncbi:hypothetical protein ACVWZK_005564 [Bradyrhizobium sp. GM0.4]
MEITVAGTRLTRRAPKENFTGTVWQDPVIMGARAGTAELLACLVRAWRTHQLASSSARADPLRHLRCRPRSDQRRARQGDPSRRHRLDSAG